MRSRRAYVVHARSFSACAETLFELPQQRARPSLRTRSRRSGRVRIFPGFVLLETLVNQPAQHHHQDERDVQYNEACVHKGKPRAVDEWNCL